MAITSDGGSTAPAVIYQEVKAWIAQQEAFEAQYNKPAPLTDIQRMALQALRLPTATPSPPPPPPPHAAATAPAASVAEINYVGILMEYHQKRNQLDHLQFVEEASGILPGGVTGRVCRVTTVETLAHDSGHIKYFPAVGYGLNDDGYEPRFTNKKAAKHFAAKCAVEWFVAQGLIHSHLQTTSPFSKAQTSGLATAGFKRAIHSPNYPTPSPPLRQNMAALPGRHEDTIPSPPPQQATELVHGLCCELKLDHPQYDLVEIAPDIFDGRALFHHCGDEELISLTEASIVHSIVGKDAAKKAVAAKLLEKLREIDAEREKLLSFCNL